MKKNFTALAIAVAGMTAQDAFATISATAILNGTQIQVGCTAPSSTGATVYSLDATAINPALNPTVTDTIALPSGVSLGAACSTALSALGQTSINIGGKWVGPGQNGTTNLGASPVNVTIPGSGYSLQAYTFVAQ